MNAVLSLAVLAAVSAPADMALLHFSSQRCPHCQAMQPIVAQLAQQGVPVQVIDVDQHLSVARDYKVQGVPTFVALRAGQEAGRIEGVTTAEKLLALTQTDKAATGTPAQQGSGRGISGEILAPEAIARSATVRIKVEDATGFGFGTGTIIDTHDGESLAVTCGHIFRESKGQGKITADVFSAGASQSVAGQLIAYDLDRDIALISLRTGTAVPKVAMDATLADALLEITRTGMGMTAIVDRRQKLLGARVIPVKSGSRTLKDAVNEAIRDWVTNVRDTHYIIGSVIGPHPYPMMVRDFQSVIGRETALQLRALGAKADRLVACVGGGSNSIGLFHPYLRSRVKMLGIEAAGLGLHTKKHAATLSKGGIGVLHGSKSEVLQDREGQIDLAHSISAGLDYPGVGPEHSWLKDAGRVKYVAVTDREALDAFQLSTRLEGIIPALEPSHALAYVKKLAPKLPRDNLLVMNMCGRGDKDIFAVAEHLHMEM